MNASPSQELFVVGGGVLGAAIAFGACTAGATVTLLDQGDTAHRASRGNFGLVWVQSKGATSWPYARWSRDAIGHWPRLAKELLELTGIDVALSQPGGIHLCMSEAAMEERDTLLGTIHGAIGGVPYEMLDRAELKQRLPAIGPKVAGASYCPLDGHANPLLLLYALHAALKARGARILTNTDVVSITPRESAGGFDIKSRDGRTWRAPRVAIAAGLENNTLAPQVGLHSPVAPNRGQMLITERLKPFMPYATDGVRQTNEGGVQVATSFEDVGLDNGTTTAVIENLAKEAVTAFPVLAHVRLVRAWGCLRVLTPDSLPIYEESTKYPGAFVATSHSGISLAGIHARVVGPWMAGLGGPPQEVEEFSGQRFLDPNRSFVNAFLSVHANAHAH